MLKRIATASLVLTLAVTGAAFAAALATGAKVTLHSTATKGKVLATSTGRTLYLDTADGRNKSRCTGSCAGLWPPLMTKGKPVAGAGVKQSLLGTLKRGTKLQVSYNGHPLYTWSGDTKAGQTTGEGLEGFFVVGANGRKK